MALLSFLVGWFLPQRLGSWIQVSTSLTSLTAGTTLHSFTLSTTTVVTDEHCMGPSDYLENTTLKVRVKPTW